MRPVLRGPSPQPHDFADYRDAFAELMSRLGPYCSYCERRIPTQLAVEHIQPKDLAQYRALQGRWDNFLLACVNCNSTKGHKDVILASVLLPDRDNTFLVFTYAEDGTVDVRQTLSDAAAAQAQATLDLVGLHKPIAQSFDSNGKLVAIDRVSQRLEAWLLALESKNVLEAEPGNTGLRKQIARTAKTCGFFSIWMSVFASDQDIRGRLIDAFAGTRGSACFHPTTNAPIEPAPNPDGLADGGKL